ncbi:unnamed protein product [Nezara viridula]|uniref:Gustatory receptor n=1 Tax=Nezara viridula TaxID=85310 RepID=A0A9P0E4S0_NEZVI|nr:unnamed protein product [Nezara viridula]
MKKYPGMTYQFSWKLYSYCILIGLIACVEGTYWMLAGFQHYSHSVSIIIESIGFWFNVFTWVSVLIQYYLQREILPDIISRLYAVHCRIGITVYRRRYATGIFFLTLLNAIPSIMYIGSDILFVDFLLVSTYFIFINVPVIMACQYSVLMSLLTDQLTFLTNQFRLPMFSFDVRQLVKNHHALCVLANRINKGFNIFLLQATAIPFVLIVINIYIVVVCIVKPQEFDEDSKLLTAVMDALVNIGIITLIVTAAKGAEDSASILIDCAIFAKDFNIQLWNNMLISKTLGKDNDLKIYVYMNNNIQQTACGFFELDYTLLTSVRTSQIS